MKLILPVLVTAVTLAGCVRKQSDSGRFVQLARQMASFPDCDDVEVISAFRGPTHAWETGEEYRVRISLPCERSWLSRLRGRDDLRWPVQQEEDDLFDNGLDRKVGRMTVAFKGDGEVTFALRDMRKAVE